MSSCCGVSANVDKRKRQEEDQEKNENEKKFCAEMCRRWNIPLTLLLIKVFDEYVEEKVLAGEINSIQFSAKEWRDMWKTFHDRARATNLCFENNQGFKISALRTKIENMKSKKCSHMENIKINYGESWEKWEKCAALTKRIAMSSSKTGSSQKSTNSGFPEFMMLQPVMKDAFRIINKMNLKMNLYRRARDVIITSSDIRVLYGFTLVKKSERRNYLKTHILKNS